MQVFISYKREDVDFARRLYASVQASNFTPWLDVVNLRPGDDWDTSIHQGMKNSEIIVGVLTPESLASRNVLDEWGYALSTGKRLFLLWLREVDEADIPPRYIRIQRIDMRHDEAAGMDQLRAALLSTAKIVPTLIPASETDLVGEGSALPQSAITAQALSTPSAKPESAPTFNEKETPALQAQQKTNRNRMLEKIKVFWIQGVLEQSVHGTALLELGIEPRSNAVENPWDTVLQHTMYGDYRLPTGTNISEIYHDLNGELLILGDPGSGKTTMLLELTRDLVTLAERDDAEPIPVVLNLSSWADDRKPLDKWLVGELNTKYAVPRKVAAAWVESNALLLLLDGLDEVLLRYRDPCVQAINDFRNEHGFTRIVVCSRSADYEALSIRLHLNGAIVLQPLKEKQIDAYLGNLGSEMQGVRAAMATDRDLHKLAESPLMLSIMTLAFRGLHVDELPPLQSIEAQRRRLFETYTRRMFERRPPRRDTPEHIMHYLQWLAGRMVERKQSVFYIENLQNDWIAGDLPRRLYRIIGRTLFGALSGAVIGIISGLALVVVLALLGDTTLRSIPPDGLIAFAFIFVALPAGLGALAFAISGLQAYALASIPADFRPFRVMLRRIMGVIAAGAGLGLIYAMVLGLGLLILALLLNALQPEYMSFYRSSDKGGTLVGWVALIPVGIIGLGSALGLGALLGAINAAVAVAVNAIQPRRRLLLGLVTLGLYSTLLGLIIVALAWVATGIFISGEIDLLLFAKFVLSFAITGMGLALAATVLPKRFPVLPYILFALVLMAGILVFAALTAVMSGDPPVISLVTGLGVVIPLLAMAALGYVAGRVNDHIESAESLRWRWSWRWSLIGLVGVILLGLSLSSGVVSDYSHWTEKGEANYVKDNLPMAQGQLDTTNSALAQANAHWAQYAIAVPDFATIGALVDQQVRLEGQIANSSYGFYSDFIPQTLQRAGCPFSEIYVYFDPSFVRSDSPSTSTNQLRDQLKAVTTQLAAYPPEQIGVWTSTREAQLYCQPMADTIRSSIFDGQRHNTLEGIRQAAVDVIKLTLVLGLTFIFGGGVIGGLHKTETIEIRTRPNSGIHRTLQSAMRVIIAFGLVGAVMGGLISGLLTTLPESVTRLEASVQGIAVPVGIVLGLSLGMAAGFLMGGIDAVVKHAVLRLFLQRSDSIPRNYAALLDDAADRVLLRKVGGGYIFIHRYLLEYYASLEGQPDNPASTS